MAEAICSWKETEIGLIPADWNLVQLKEICFLGRENVDPQDLPQMPYVGLEHIDSGDSRLKRWGDSSEVKSSKNKFIPGDVLYGKLRPYLDKAVLAEFEGVCSTDILVFKANPRLAISQFLTHLLHTQRFLDYAISTTSGTNLPRTRWTSLRDFRVPLPPLPEQRHIARVLNAIQRSIAAQDDVIAAARALKRSLMQRLFTYGPGLQPAETKETEIGEIPAHWEVVRLEYLIASGPQNGLYKPASYYGDGTPILRIDAFDCGDIVEKQQLKRLELSDDELGSFGLSPGDIVVNRVNGNVEILGKCALIGQISEPTVFESNMMKFVVDTKLVLNSYLVQFWCSPKLRIQIRKKARIVHQTSINQQDLKSFLIPLPGMNEQESIAQSLDAIDCKIAAEEQCKFALEALFKSALHQLMSGQIRLTQDGKEE